MPETTPEEQFFLIDKIPDEFLDKVMYELIGNKVRMFGCGCQVISVNPKKRTFSLSLKGVFIPAATSDKEKGK